MTYSTKTLGVILSYYKFLRLLPLDPPLEKLAYKNALKKYFLSLGVFDHLQDTNFSYKTQNDNVRDLRVTRQNGKIEARALIYLDFPLNKFLEFSEETNLRTLPLPQLKELFLQICQGGTTEGISVLYQIRGASLTEVIAREGISVALERWNYEIVKSILSYSTSDSFWISIFNEVRRNSRENREFRSPTAYLAEYNFYTWFYVRTSLKVREKCLWDDITDSLLPRAYYRALDKINLNGPHYPMALKTLRGALMIENLELFKIIYSKITPKGPSGFWMNLIALPSSFLKYLGKEDKFQALDVDQQIGLILGQDRFEKLDTILRYAETPERVTRIFSLSLKATRENPLEMKALAKKYGESLPYENWLKFLWQAFRKDDFSKKIFDLAQAKTSLVGSKKEIYWVLDRLDKKLWIDPKNSLIVNFIQRVCVCRWTLSETKDLIFRYHESPFFYKIFSTLITWSENPKSPIFSKAIEHAFHQALRKGSSYFANFYHKKYDPPLDKIPQGTLRKAFKKGVVLERASNFIREKGGTGEDRMELEVIDLW